MKINMTKSFVPGIILVCFMVLSYSAVQGQKKQKSPVPQQTTEKKIDKPDTAKIADKDGDTNKVPDKIKGPEKKESTDTSSEKGLIATVKHGGPLMIFIAFLGLISLTIIIERLIFFTKKKSWTEQKLISDITDAARRSQAHYLEEMEDELRSDFQIYANELERGMGLLSGLGNLSPIVGFLGTVIGMIDAFASIVAATTVNAKVVAGGIQVALITTAGGLIVAAPTLLFYYIFSHIVQRRYANADQVICEICSKLPRLSETVLDQNGKQSTAKKTSSKTVKTKTSVKKKSPTKKKSVPKKKSGRK